MSNPMDRVTYTAVGNNAPQANVIQQKDVASMYRMAMQNPKAFEEQFRRHNPQAYEQAVALAKSRNPKDIVMQILNKRGINPASFMLNR